MGTADIKHAYYIGPVLSKDTMTQFRAAIEGRIVGRTDARESLATAVRALAAEARESGIPAEKMVLFIKKTWDELMDDGIVSHDADHSRLRDSVVTSAIKAYYVQ